MYSVALKPLFRLSLVSPREAASQVVAMGLPANALWIALSLVSVLSALMMSSLLQLVPLTDEPMAQLLGESPARNSPMIFAILQWGRAVLTVFVLHWVGRALGGQGSLQDVLGVITWLQAMTFALIAILMVVGMIIPILSSLGFLVFVGWYLWSVVTYIDEAHEFDNPFKAIGVLIVSIMGVLLGMSVFMALLGGIFLSGVAGGGNV